MWLNGCVRGRSIGSVGGGLIGFVSSGSEVERVC